MAIEHSSTWNFQETGHYMHSTGLAETIGNAHAQTGPRANATYSRIDCLDGLRGIAALWVLTGHCIILSGWSLPVVDKPDLGVDLFMMLSGYLMVFQYRLRSEREPWDDSKTWMRFWLRRYFRIAPLYYAMLALCVALALATFYSMLSTSSLGHALYTDTSLANILAHATFVFSLLPQYALGTPLPDWSLGLEMQFYAVFPALMLMTKRLGWPASVVLVALVSAVATHAVWHFSIHYPHPSLLAFKIDIFLAGMLLAESDQHGPRIAGLYLVMALALALEPFQGEGSALRTVVREILVLTFFSLVLHRFLPRPFSYRIAKLSATLGGNPFRWLGDVSYSVYLLHLPIMAALAALFALYFGTDVSAPVRFAILLAAGCLVVYPLSWLTYRYIEVTGQEAGRRLLQRIARKPADHLSDKVDSYAAP